MTFPTTEKHFRKYANICALWGLVVDQELVFGLTRDQMAERLSADPDLNNVETLAQWDARAIHLAGRRKPDGRAASLGEAVCAVKHSVRVWCGGEPVFGVEP